MKEIRLGEGEMRFARIIWDKAPMSSRQLAALALEELGWKKSTAYTVLKRLTEKGVVKNEGGVVSRLMTKDEFYSLQSENFVRENFGGSLPAFLAAFGKGTKMSDEEIDSLKQIIEKMRGYQPWQKKFFLLFLK